MTKTGRLLRAIPLVWGIAACDVSYQFDTGALATDAAADGADAAPPARCGVETDCPTPLHCEVAAGSCVQCLADGDCVDPVRTHCDASLHRCVECTATADCGAGRTCRIDIRRCLTTCGQDAGQVCAAGVECEESLGYCSTCSDDHRCPTGQVCDGAAGRCVQCVADSDCVAPTSRCSRERGLCLGCIDRDDCPPLTPWCSPETGTCLGAR